MNKNFKKLILPWIKTEYSFNITGINSNSQYIKPGNLFCAIKNNSTQKKIYILQAIKNGTSIILYDTKKKSNMEL
ncbi:MAG: hypothetical protein UAR70_01015 [Buchnera aphidicola (Chaetogeoica yunlongensis)]